MVCVIESCAVTSPAPHHSPAVLHEYRFEVKDADGSPMEGVSITSTLYDHTERKADTLVNTDREGKAAFEVSASADTTDAYQNFYTTKCVYSVFKNGYLPEYGTEVNSYLLTDLSARGHRGLTEKSIDITLLRVSDLVGGNLGSDSTENNFIQRYAERLHRAMNERGIVLPRHSMQIMPEDAKRLLSVTLQTVNVVNSDLLDSAGIAKTFFQIAGREALEMLRDETGSLAKIDGFSFTLTGTKKHFNIRTDNAVPVECRFVIDKDALSTTVPKDENSRILSHARVWVDGKLLSSFRFE